MAHRPMQTHDDPVKHGRRLLPVLIDKLACSCPRKVFVAIPKSRKPEDGFIDIDYGQLASSINKCSWWLEERLGRGNEFPTISYIGPLDLRYTIIMFAAVKVGFKVR